MREQDFGPDAPGQLIKLVDGYTTFLPNPLPPNLIIDLQRARVISEADHALGELAGVGRMLPNPHLLIRPFLRREAVLSSRIEGTIASLRQLVMFEEEDAPAAETGDVREVFNYVAALERGLELLDDGIPVSLWMARQLHQVLLNGVRGEDKRPGQFRIEQNFIGTRRQGVSSASYVPPPVTELMGALEQWEAFVRSNAEMPFLVKLALVHYQFEAIHPFVDGNGRIGRLLIPLLLCEQKLMPQPLLYLSDYLDRRREEYFHCLLRVTQQGAWMDWIAFFVEGVSVQAKDAVERAKRLLQLWQEYRDILQASGGSIRVLQLVDGLFERPTITISRAAQYLKVTPRGARLMIEKLEAAGIIVEGTGRPRNRIYVAPGILRVLEEDLS